MNKDTLAAPLCVQETPHRLDNHFPLSHMGPQFTRSVDDSTNLLPAYTGSVYMVNTIEEKKRRVAVVFSIYRTFYEFYAVISQDRVILKDFGYINLKRCLLQRENLTIRLTPIGRHAVGQTLQLQLPTAADVDKVYAIFDMGDDPESFAAMDNTLDIISETGELFTHSDYNDRSATRGAPPPNANIPKRRRKTSLPALIEED